MSKRQNVSGASNLGVSGSTLRCVIVELNTESVTVPAEGFAALAALDTMPDLGAFRIDPTFAPVAIPAQVTEMADFAAAEERDDAPPMLQIKSHVVRGEVEESQIANLRANPAVKEVYADVLIQPCLTCPASPPLGDDKLVEKLLCVEQLRAKGMDGRGVYVAIVDTGINLAYLNGHGKHPQFDAARSWVPRPGLIPGQLPVNHGTMCAFDVCIAAPACTLLDIAVLQSNTPGHTVMEGLLSDAVRAYSHLLGIMTASRRPGECRSMVVSNSWGMFNPSWDFPVGNPGNYSDNPNHPFNLIVGTLARAGADILFAAGNCGKDCPDGRCGGITAKAIYGANSHPQVTCVAGVDTARNRVGYSAIGPGRLAPSKPDLCGYTHFKGSGVYPADGGTSAACPVAAGVFAAIRAARPFVPSDPKSNPASIRALVSKAAIDRGSPGYDYEYGWGIINGCALATAPKTDSCHCHGGTNTPSNDGPAPSTPENQLSITLPADAAAGVGTQLRTFFSRLTPDAAPGDNTLTINGLPPGTRVVSAWMTEFVLPNNPHAGGAVFETKSVQLYNDGRSCRVKFKLDWGGHLPAACQVIYGPG